MTSRRLIVAVALALLTGAGTLAQSRTSWPQALGPNRNNVTSEGLGTSPVLSIRWRTSVPEGRGAFVAHGDRLYSIGNDGTSEVAFALDAATGREVWRTSLGAAHESAEPLATPAVVNNVVVALTTSCVLHGVNATSGAKVWERSLVTDFTSRLASGGCTMSPLIHGSTVVTPTGSRAGGVMIAALDAASGQTTWTLSGVPASLSTPMSVGQFGAEQLLLYYHAKPPGTGGITAIRITGSSAAVAWQVDLPSNMSDTAPLALPGNKLLLQTWNESHLIDASAAPAISWSTRDLWALFPPPTYHNTTLYGFGGNSTEFFSAVDIASGKTLWTERIYRGYVVNAGGTLVVLSESSGLLRLVAADPAKYRELARIALFRPGLRTATPPIVAGGRIIVRNVGEAVGIGAGIGESEIGKR